MQLEAVQIGLIQYFWLFWASFLSNLIKATLRYLQPILRPQFTTATNFPSSTYHFWYLLLKRILTKRCLFNFRVFASSHYIFHNFFSRSGRTEVRHSRAPQVSALVYLKRNVLAWLKRWCYPTMRMAKGSTEKAINWWAMQLNIKSIGANHKSKPMNIMESSSSDIIFLQKPIIILEKLLTNNDYLGLNMWNLLLFWQGQAILWSPQAIRWPPKAIRWSPKANRWSPQAIWWSRQASRCKTVLYKSHIAAKNQRNQ